MSESTIGITNITETKEYEELFIKKEYAKKLTIKIIKWI